MLTPRQRTLRARIAANGGVSQSGYGYKARAATKAATTAYWARYHQQVDPTASLSIQEPARAAKAACKADMDRARLRTSKKHNPKSAPQSTIQETKPTHEH